MLSVRPLHSTGVTPLPRYYGPLRFPTEPLRRLCLPAARWSLSLPPCRASQAPRLIFPRALSPTTPEGPMAACACCFATGLVWLHPSRRTGHLRIPIEAESGSLALRLACSPPEFSPTPLLELTLVWLHAEQAIYMVNSFQFTRSARLTWHTDRKGVGFLGSIKTSIRSKTQLGSCSTTESRAIATPNRRPSVKSGARARFSPKEL